MTDGVPGIADGLTKIIDPQSGTAVLASQLAQFLDKSVVPDHRVVSRDEVSRDCRPADHLPNVVEGEGDGIGRAGQSGQGDFCAVLPKKGNVARESIGVSGVTVVGVGGDQAAVVDCLLPVEAIGKVGLGAQVGDGVAPRRSGTRDRGGEREGHSGQRKTNPNACILYD
jgi:hypothetical protein